MAGHADNIVDLYFSPDGGNLATGSGDKTVRFWDVHTQTPRFTCKGHGHWVQCIAWAPDGALVASGSRDNSVRVWDPRTGTEATRALTGHRQRINWLAWEPLHLARTAGGARRLASASSDHTVKVWDLDKAGATRLHMTLGQHTKPVTTVKWGGEGLIYSASQDRDICVWRADDGTLCRTLRGHAHWVNSLALNTDHVLRTGAYDERGRLPKGLAPGDDLRAAARARWEKVKGAGHERLASGSEDNTLFLWEGGRDKKPLMRITGHQRPIMFVAFSPDGRQLASSSVDKSCKLWDGRTGKFVLTFRGHAGPVYRITWAPDSRMLITASEDSTIKLWSVKGQLVSDLPGHAGSVFAVDWAPSGGRVGSGGADKMLKLWTQ